MALGTAGLRGPANAYLWLIRGGQAVAGRAAASPEVVLDAEFGDYCRSNFTRSSMGPGKEAHSVRASTSE
jgi:hypothetical protein